MDSSEGSKVQEGEAFTLFDIDGVSSSSSPHGDQDEKMPVWPVYLFNALNMVTGCATLAVAKQLFNPANFMVREKDVKNLPSWYASNYTKSISKVAVRRIFYDMGVLMVASGMYQGINVGLRAARGTDDAANLSVAGGVSAAFLGATFFDTTSFRRVGIWGVTGALLGYYGFQERQAIREQLLDRQKELEQRLMHVSADKVHTELDVNLYRRLLKLEEQDKLDHIKDHLQQQGALSAPSSAVAAAASDGGGSSSSNGLYGEGIGGDGTAAADADSAWSGLMQSAPWLSGSNSSSSSDNVARPQR